MSLKPAAAWVASPRPWIGGETVDALESLCTGTIPEATPPPPPSEAETLKYLPVCVD